MADIAKRFAENPILKPADIRPSIAGMKVECLLNPGVFRFDDKTWLLLRVAERPEQKPGKTSFPDPGRKRASCRFWNSTTQIRSSIAPTPGSSATTAKTT